MKIVISIDGTSKICGGAPRWSTSARRNPGPTLTKREIAARGELPQTTQRLRSFVCDRREEQKAISLIFHEREVGRGARFFEFSGGVA